MPESTASPSARAQLPRSAVLLVNLGTPEAPTSAAVRRYLRQFLSDSRVVEIPRLLWWVILNGIILVTRPAASAKKYASIWMNEGSPLRVHTARLTDALAREFNGGAGAPLVAYAMRYGNPSVAEVVDGLLHEGAERLVVVPMYPQYAASTTASAIDALGLHLRTLRNMPAVSWIKSFHDHPAYIGALACQINEYWQQHGRPERLLMSFHGLPRFCIDKGDPYEDHCRITARLLAGALALSENQWQISFQSRFGRAQWIEPATSNVLEQWGREKLARVDVVCPGFLADCLETLEEIGIEGRHSFLQAGGKAFHLIPCLNERADWAVALKEIIETQV